MLDAILRLAAQGGMVTVNEVARKLAISPQLAESLFFELERQGYLKHVSTACDAPCGACAAKEACRFFKEPRLWTFTEKGVLAVRRLSEKSATDGADD